MLNKKEFEDIIKELKKFDEEREKTIRQSRDIIQLSKQIIYAVQRDDISSADALVKEIKEKAKKLPLKFYDTEMDAVAMQELVEAVVFYEFVKNNKMPSRKELGAETTAYLMGLCDLTGELVRKAVKDVINKRYSEAKKIKDLVDEIYGEFLKFDLRNGDLRKKADQIKWNLKKLEEMEYDVARK
ncbi:MAG: hypothetical protein Q7J54_00705 [Candidatus Woesearchaeota archaeon]|nr:hypothetical protein [Candidatus Woesearchaeota archaeon]